MKFVDFTRFFDHFLVPECGSFGGQVARKPRPRALKRRVSGRKRYLEAQFIIPDRNESGRFFPILDPSWPFWVKSDHLVGSRSRSARHPAAEPGPGGGAVRDYVLAD